MSLRLVYNGQDFLLPIGDFVIGRSGDCDLILDDPLASRRHARIAVREGSATLEDMGSRNGLYLNGVRVDRAEPLHDGDRIRLAEQDLVFRDSSEGNSMSAHARRRATMPHVIKRTDDDDDERSESTGIVQMPIPPGVRLSEGLNLMGGLAEKALAMGRADEAERLLQRALGEIVTHAARGSVGLDLCERAATHAARLASATGRGSWIDYVFQLYGGIPALVPARVVDELYAVVRKVKQTDKSILRAYTARLRGISQNFGPAERFVQQRIEGFERWAP